MPSDIPSGTTLPLFYQAPQPLNAALHGGWHLKDGDFAFAAAAAMVPIVVGELVAAARDYPVVFSSGDAAPIAVLGLEQDNLFVSAGTWADAYVPAYVRRYPFGFAATQNPDGFALVIDTAADRVRQTGGEGAALFEDGKPSLLIRQALEFCDLFQAEAAATAAFSAALRESDLLIDQQADITLADGEKRGLTGFRIVDAAKFAQMDAKTIVNWHAKGWLALVQFHLASLDRFQALLARRNGRATESAATDAPANVDIPAVEAVG